MLVEDEGQTVVGRRGGENRVLVEGRGKQAVSGGEGQTVDG